MGLFPAAWSIYPTGIVRMRTGTYFAIITGNYSEIFIRESWDYNWLLIFLFIVIVYTYMRTYSWFVIYLNSASFCYAHPRFRPLFSFPNLGTLPFSKSGTRSREIRSRIGKQSVGRTLRGLLLSRRSLPFKPPPILTLPRFLHSASSCPSPYLVPPSRGTFLSPSFSFLCTLGKPAFTRPPSLPLSHRWVSSRCRLLLRASRRNPMAKPRRPD